MNVGPAWLTVCASLRSTSANTMLPEALSRAVEPTTPVISPNDLVAVVEPAVIVGASSAPPIVIFTSCVANPPLPSDTCTVNVSTTWSFFPRKSSALSLML